MDLNDWVKVFDRLLPRSRAWGLIVDRPLRRFFHGLSILPQMIRDHIASVLLEAFPLTTTKLEDYSKQFGSPATLTPTELDAEWGAFGGSSPAYIQGVLQAAGFDVYVHEWWVPGSDPVEARNPIALIDTSYVLVNDLGWYDKIYTHQFGDGVSQFVGDESVQFGAYSGWFFAPKLYPCPDNEEEYPVYYYIGASEWPDYCVIPQSKFRTLVRLIYKTKPCHLRCILRAIVYDDSGEEDGDIKDTPWEDDEWKDIIVGDDDFKDHP